MVKVLFRRPCHVPPCLINREGGSNYSLIRFIRFVSPFTDSSRNTFFISSRFKSPYKCRKKNLEFGNMELNTALEAIIVDA